MEQPSALAEILTKLLLTNENHEKRIKELEKEVATLKGDKQ